jgi:hypothetical protein
MGAEIGGFKVLEKTRFYSPQFFDVICLYGNEHTKDQLQFWMVHDGKEKRMFR